MDQTIQGPLDASDSSRATTHRSCSNLLHKEQCEAEADLFVILSNCVLGTNFDFKVTSTNTVWVIYTHFAHKTCKFR